MEETSKSLTVRISERLTTWVGSPASIIAHTVFFIGIFGLAFFNVPVEQILLILTTAVSLEAIYLAIFIQMTVNRHTESLQDVGEDIEELGEEVEDLGDDLEELGDDLEELGDEVEDISEDIEEISGDIDKIQEDEVEEEKEEEATRASLSHIETALQKLLSDIETLKKDGK